PIEGRGEPRPDWIPDHYERDRRVSLRDRCRRAAEHENSSHLESSQLGDQVRNSLELSLCKSGLDNEGRAFDPALVPQSLLERREKHSRLTGGGSRGKKADARDVPRRLSNGRASTRAGEAGEEHTGRDNSCTDQHELTAALLVAGRGDGTSGQSQRREKLSSCRICHVPSLQHAQTGGILAERGQRHLPN